MGSGISLPPISQLRPIEQPDLLGMAGKVAQLRNMQQQFQGGQLENQQHAQQLKDSQAMTQAMLSWDPNSGYDALAHSVLQMGGSANAATALHTHGLEVRQKALEIAKTDEENQTKHLQNLATRHDLLLGHLNTVVDGPDEGIGDRLLAATQQAQQDGLIDAPHVQQISQFAPLPAAQLRPALSIFEKNLQGEKVQFERAMKEREQNAAEWKSGGLGQLLNTRTGETKGTLRLPPPSEVELAVKAAAGDAAAEAALKRLDKSRLASRPVNNLMTGSDAKDIADAIENGDQPPTLTGLYRNAGPVRAELARRGFNLQAAETDWKAVQRHVSTLNGTQQERLRQSITSAGDMLDKIDGLYSEWAQIAPTTGYKILNRAALTAMKNLPGRPGAVANALDAQIADLTADLGNVYMGGNSPTDQSLKLAGQNLKTEWNQQTFTEALKQARLNLTIRKNSILHSQPAGVSQGSPYLPANQQSAGGAGNTQPPQGGGFDWNQMPRHQ